MIETMDIIPIVGRAYEDPGDAQQVILATSKGDSSLWWTIKVQKPIPEWGPNGTMRLEGVATYKGARCQVIAWYRLGSTDAKVGTMQIHAPNPPMP